MSMFDLLANLHQKNIRVTAENGQLKLDAPKGALNEDLLRQLREQKNDILAYLESAAHQNERITPCDRSGSLPLSFAQQRLWLIDKMEGGSSHYNVSSAFEVSGAFDLAIAEQAFEQIVARHETLRTVFIEDERKGARQVIENAASFNIQVMDFSAHELEASANLVDECIVKDAEAPFDLTRDLMLRVTFLRFAHNRGVLLFSTHHIASDAWSLGVLVHEFGELYQAIADNRPPVLPELAIQYADYAAWQRDWLSGERLEKQLGYWKKQLADLPKVHGLPLDYPRSLQQSYAGVSYVDRVPDSVYAKLSTIAKDSKSSLFMVLHAAFSVLLARHANNRDVVIGTPVANRTQKALENLIGFFVNNLVLRVDCSAQVSFTEFLTQVKQVNLAAQSHQDVQFDQIVEQLNPERTNQHTPLFQIMLSMNTNDRFELSVPGCSLTPIIGKELETRYEIILYANEDEQGLGFNWVYNKALFKAETVHRLADHLQRLLADIANNPDKCIQQLEMLSAEEQLALKRFATVNESKLADAESLPSVLSRFEGHARQKPDVTAAVCEGRAVSYQALDTQANRLAHYLRAQGVQAGDRVGLYFERSIDMLVGLLATFKAGAGFVALEPAYPPSRLRFMLADSGTVQVLSHQTLKDSISNLGEVDVTLIDDCPALDQQPVYALDRAGDLTSLPAYLVYTSGTTGEPKAVSVSQANLSAYLCGLLAQFDVPEGMRYGVMSTLATDLGHTALFIGLVQGGELHLISDDIARDAQAFTRYRQEQGLEFLKLTPNHFNALFPSATLAEAHSLKWLFVGGEAASGDAVEKLSSLAGLGVRVVNHYGPTEGTIGATTWSVPARHDRSNLPIGQPLPQVTTYILNEAFHPVPQGCFGELFIGGAGVAEGYLNRPELTRERFIANPFGEGRLYRTGDRARYLETGDIEFAGRVDDQVKIRGYRIELKEIEAQLAGLEGISAAVAKVAEDDSGAQRILAYAVCDNSVSTSEETALQNLETHLPEYMVPSALIFLSELPLTANGKVDRAALPEPAGVDDHSDYVAPQNEVEQTLVGIWAKILKADAESFSTTANFFESGGDSILSILMISQAAKAGLVLSPKLLINHQTIQTLAPHVRLKGEADNNKAALEVTGRQPLLPVQHRFFEHKVDSHHYNQSVLIKTPADFTLEHLRDMVSWVLRKHDVLRLRFTETTAVPEGHYRPFADAMVSDCTEQHGMGSFDNEDFTERLSQVQRSLSITEGPLIRFALFSADDEPEGRLLIAANHLVIDGVSWRILLSDLEQLAQMAGDTARKREWLKQKTTAYQYWGQRLADYATRDAHHASLKQWQTVVQTQAPATLCPEVTGESRHEESAEIHFDLAETLTQQLLKAAPQAYRAQVNEILLSALVLALKSWSGTSVLGIDLESHGREPSLFDNEDLDFSQTLGWFTSVYPVVLEPVGENLAETLMAVKDQVRTVNRGGVEFGILKYLKRDETLLKYGRPPVIFNYLGQFDDAQNDDSIFALASEPTGEEISPNRPLAYELNVSAIIVGRSLRYSILYDTSRFSRDAMARLMLQLQQSLQALIQHCVEASHTLCSPSDFPLAYAQESQRLDRGQLEELRADGYRFALETPDAPAVKVIEDIYPVTAMQRGLLFHSALDDSAYVSQLIMHFKGPLDVDNFQSAWRQVIERHSIFRTFFIGLNRSTAFQVVKQAASLPFHMEDLSSYEPAVQARMLDKAVSEDKAQGFDVSQAPLMRVSVFKLSDSRHQVVWSRHHALSDGWSSQKVFEEVTEAYRAQLEQCTWHSSEPPPYRNYIEWLQQQNSQAAMQFWEDYLSSVSSPTRIGVAGVDVNESDTGLDREILRLDSSLSQAVDKLAKVSKTTVSTVVQAAWAYLLYRYSGDETVVFGETVSGRPSDLPGVETMVGLFINSLPVCARIDANASVQSWLQALHQSSMERTEHGFVPLGDIQQCCSIEKQSELFSSLIVFESYPGDAGGQSDSEGKGDDTLHLSSFETDEYTHYDLTLCVEPAEELEFRLEYQKNRYSKVIIEQMLSHLARVLEQFSVDRFQSISGLSLLTERETSQLLQEWNSPAVSYDPTPTIHQRFVNQAGRTPDAVAITHNGESLTYRELDAYSNRIAAYLQEKGVTRGDLVAIYAYRSVHFLASMLGIMKAGGAYVPLDPINPPERIRYMVDNSNTRVLITESRLAGKVTLDESVTLLQLDIDQSMIARYSDAAVMVDTQGDDLAYMIYTSGSTGMPKGALVHHAGALNHIDAEFDVLGFMDSERNLLPRNFLQSAASSSDVSVWQFLAPVICGGKTVVLDDMTDLPNLARQMQAENVHLIQCAPVVLQLLVEYMAELMPELRALPELKWMMCIAEASPVKLINQWLFLYPHVPVMNGYGPSEASDDITYYIVDQPLPDSERNILIGKPLPNLTAFVVDSQLKLQPMGVPGELCISGVGVGPGYWNNPEKTANAFVRNPYFDPDDTDGVHGERMYRTGDLARWLPDGNLEFMGRLDNQTKVRGFRIELGEVEASLAKLDGIGEVAVLVRKDRQGKNALAAYIVWRSEQPFSVEWVRNELASSLPDYMIPATFTLMDKMPLTPADKIDRKALPEPEQAANDNYVAPVTETERQLAELWQELLGSAQVGRQDNFFACGGDSILTIQLVARARKIGIHLSPKHVLESQSLMAMAASAGSEMEIDAPQYPITGHQNWLPVQTQWLAGDETDRHHYNQSVLLRIPEAFNDDSLRQTITALIKKHDALRLKVVEGEGEYCPFHSAQVDAAVDVIDLKGLPEADKPDQRRRICEQAQETLSLTDNRLIRAVLIDDEISENRRLLLVIHHLVVDGVSWRILKEDLEQAHRQLVAGESIDLGPKTSSLQQWANDLRRYAHERLAPSEAAYWQAQDVIEVPALPVDSSAVNTTMATLTQQRFTLDTGLTSALETDCHQAYRTRPDHLILAAMAQALNGWTGNQSFRIEMEGHGRTELLEHLDVSETLGWFTSLYPLVLNLPSESTDAELLISVKEQCNAVPNQGIGYGLLTDNQGVCAPISYNNLGQTGYESEQPGAFQLADDDYGNEVSPRREREHPLAFSVQTQGDRLVLSIRYSREEFRNERIEALGTHIIEGLERLIRHCLAADTPRFTPSDFPVVSLAQTQIDTWQANYPNLQKLYASTPMQQGMLFHSALESAAYCSQLVLDMVGELDTAAFRQAWQSIVNRHDIFRTGFVGPNRHQLVVTEAEIPWFEFDYRNRDSAQQSEAFAQYRQNDKAQGFNPEQIPLMRLALFRLSDSEYRLLWTNHHVLMDGWSLPIVFNQVIECYQQLLSNRFTPVPASEFPQYDQYIKWLHQRSPDEAEQFWRDYLADIEAPTELNLPQVSQTGNGSGSDLQQHECHYQVDATLTERLHHRAKTSKTTLNVLMQAAWSYLLHYYSGEERVVFGETVSGRPGDLEDVEDIVGLFINSLPVKVSLTSSQPVNEWLATLHQQSSQRADYGYLSLPQIQSQTALTSESSLFDTLLVFENFPVTEQLDHIAGIDLTGVQADEQTNFDLTLVIYAGETLKLNLRYPAQRYATPIMDQLLRHFAQVLESLADRSVETIADIRVLDEQEEKRLLSARPRVPGRRCSTVDVAKDVVQIQQMFEHQVDKAPEAVALTYPGSESGPDEFLTYRQLDEKANRLAHYLRSFSITPDTLVGICLDRSTDMVVAILAVLKSGAAYVPLDAGYPQDRLDYIVGDSQMTLLITDSALVPSLNTFDGKVTTIALNSPDVTQAVSQQPCVRPGMLPNATANDLAYIIYTSGSTGQPKGVMVEHRNVTRLMQVADNDFDFSANDVWTLFHSFAFDFSVWEIWGALANGARLVVVPKVVAQSTEEFYQLMVREQVTVLNQTPTAFEQICRVDQRQPRPLALRYVIFGGEALKLESLRQWVNDHGDQQPALVNMYGITETTVHVTYRNITQADIETGRGSPIGYPLSDLRIYILDQHLRPLPTGCRGEIFVTGGGVTRGYLHKPELTEQRFIQSPFADGEVLYRTGDIGRYLPGGDVDYVGRADNQVKIRGYRIELGEIEHQLMLIDGVGSALVTVHNQSSLLAYVTPQEPRHADTSEQAAFIAQLRDALGKTLPEHMRPGLFVVLEAFPLTAHGKIDTRALPAPDMASQQTQYVPPTTDTERRLAEIWSKLLQIEVEQISARASFFELGGHSLLLIKASSELQEAFEVELSLRDILATPRLNDLAEMIQARGLSRKIRLDQDEQLRDDEVETVI